MLIRSNVNTLQNSDVIQDCFAPSATAPDTHMINLDCGHMIAGIPGVLVAFFVGKQGSPNFH